MQTNEQSTSMGDFGQSPASDISSGDDIQHLSLDDMGRDAVAALFEVPGEGKEQLVQEETISDDIDEDVDDTEHSASDGSDIEEAIADDVEDEVVDEADEAENLEGEVFDLQDLREAGTILAIKVDGEMKQFTMDDLQRSVGQEASATVKSKKAAEDREAAEAALAAAEHERRMAEAATSVTAEHEQMAVLKSKYAELHAKRKTALDEGDKYEARDIKDEMDELEAQFKHIKDNADNGTKAIRNEKVKRANEVIRETELGKRLFEDGDYAKEIGGFVRELGLDAGAVEAIQTNGQLTNALLELHALKKNVTPVKRKKKTLSKHLRSRTAQPAIKNQPNKAKPTIQDVDGPISLADIRDGKVSL